MRELRSGKLRYSRAREDVNPMESVANLADLMLVLACGLMLSLVISWNLNLTSSQVVSNVTQGQEMEEVEGLDQSSGAFSESTGYQEMGTVYKDPETGKLYMVTDAAE